MSGSPETTTTFDGEARAAFIRKAMIELAGAADTATGATLFLPDGEILYLSVADARAMYSTVAAGSRT